MDTHNFLAKVLPEEGYYTLATFWHGTGKDKLPSHKSYNDIRTMAKRATYFDKGTTSEHINVFYAMAAFKEPVHKDSAGRRDTTNVRALRSLWLDLDVGDSPKKYPDQATAVKALATFYKAVCLPRPLVVNSGYGIHSYWPLTTEIDPAQWQKLANALAACAAHEGLNYDRACTQDSARILRPIGTHNRKHDPVPVTLVADAGPFHPVADIAAPLVAYMKTNDITPTHTHTQPQKRDGKRRFDVKSDLVTTTPAPSSIEEIAKHCQVLREVIDKKGIVEEPLWYRVIALAHYCEEGDAYAHTLSSGDPRYDHDETQAKIDQWVSKSLGAPTCESIEQHGGDCEGCPHKDKGISPRRLGYTVELGPPQATPAPTPPQRPPHTHPTGFRYNGSTLCVAITNEDGSTEWVPFLDRDIYVIDRLRDGEGEWYLQLQIVGSTEDEHYRLPSRLLARPADLATELSSKEINIMGRDGKSALIKYLLEGQKELRAQNQYSTTLNYLGWQPDSSFAVGSVIYKGAEVIHATPGEPIPSFMEVDTPERGTAEAWAAAVNEVYNRPGAEPYQFAILAAFAAPLVAPSRRQGEGGDNDEWHGIPVGLVGDSGTGKSLVAKVGLSVFGPPSMLYIHGDSSGSTENALVACFGAARNLPFLLDEISMREGSELQRIFYALSNGMAKIRCTKNGTPIKSNARWDTISYVTSNRSVMERLTTTGVGKVQGALQVRVFEIEMGRKNFDAIFAGVNGVKDIERRITSENYGAAGRKYIRAVRKNLDAVRALTSEMRANMTANHNLITSERFYRDLIANVLVAGKIAKMCGLIDFDLTAIKNWALDNILNLRDVRQEYTFDPTDSFNEFVAGLHEHTLVTRRYKSDRKDPEVPIINPRREVYARIATDDRKFFVSTKYFNDWCRDHDVSSREIRKKAVEDGYMYRSTSGSDKKVLTLGTNRPGGQTRVTLLNYDKLVRGANLSLITPTQEAAADGTN